MQYRKEIDGLRALAILPVVLFHSGFLLFSGGFVGVDVFFVISGYLITSLIWDEINSGRFTFPNFYQRRIKRLFPALIVMALVCTIVASALYLPFDLEDYGANLASVFNFSSNVHFYIHSGYFDPASDLNPLLHTWSLSVEEQFYLVLPVFLILIFKLNSRVLLPSIIALIFVSLVLSEWRINTGKPMAAFYLLYARGWELLVGSACALILRNPERIGLNSRVKNALAVVGIGLIFIAVFLYSESVYMPGIYALMPVIGTSLVILFARSDNLAGRYLSLPLFVSIGLISYSTYLWHQPLLAFVRYYFGQDFKTELAGVCSVLSFLLGYFSWRYVERPCRYAKFGADKGAFLFASAATVFVVMFSLGIMLEKRGGFPERLNAEVRGIYMTPKSFEQEEACFITKKERFANDICMPSEYSTQNMLLVGDSHAASLYPGLRAKLASQGIKLYLLAYARCIPFLDEEYLVSRVTDYGRKYLNQRCYAVKESFKKQLSGQKFDSVLVLNHLNDWLGDYKPATVENFWSEYIDALEKQFGKKSLIVLGPLPIWPDWLPKLIVTDYVNGEDFTGPSFNGLYRGGIDLDRRLGTDLNGRHIRYISSMDGLCSELGCVRTGPDAQGKIIATSYDGGHLSAAGSKILSDYLAKELNRPSVVGM